MSAHSPFTLSAIVDRELQAPDLAEAKAGTSEPGAANPLQRVRAVHHAAARILGAGGAIAEAALASGLSLQRIATLRTDPAFVELETFYASREDERFVDVQVRLQILGLGAAEELQERLLDSPAEMADDDLRKLLVAALDRAGHSPIQRAETLHAHLSASELVAMKEAAHEHRVEVGGSNEASGAPHRVLSGEQEGREAGAPEEEHGGQTQEQEAGSPNNSRPKVDADLKEPVGPVAASARLEGSGAPL